jgi:peptidoglycan/LPS O-acetylase OafA/YrhL
MTALSWVAKTFQRASDRLLGWFHVGTQSTSEVGPIDGLRALAVTGVVILHCWGVAGGPSIFFTLPLIGQKVWLSEWIHQGELGIPLFFILSGFLLGQPFFRAALKGERRPSLGNYFRRRVLRIVPAYYFCLLMMLLLLVPTAIPAERVYSWMGLQALIAHLTFTQFLFIDTGAYFRADASMWTLTHEATFYIILPFTFWLFVGRRSLIALPGSLLVAAGWLYLAHHSLDFFVNWVWRGVDDKLYFSHETIRRTYVAPQFPAHVFNFGLGLSLGNYYVMTQLGRAPKPHPLVALATFFGGLVLLMGWVHYFDFTDSSISRDFVFVGTPAEAIGITLILAGLVFGAPVVKSIFSLTPVRVIGIISYSAFLWHGLLLYAIERFPAIQAMTPDERLVPIIVRVVPLLLLVSIASYIFIEKPFLVTARRPRPEPALAEAALAPRPAPSPLPPLQPQPGVVEPLPTLSTQGPNTAV